jgi:hypothetical protein
VSNDFNDIPQPPQHQKSWLRRNLLWFGPLLLVVLACPILSCGGFVFFMFNSVQAPLTVATEAINADQHIVAKLGSPITRGSAMSVNDYSNNNGNGGATIEFNVSGPSGGAQVSGRMALTAGKWRPDGLKVTCDDGTEFQLPSQH